MIRERYHFALTPTHGCIIGNEINSPTMLARINIPDAQRARLPVSPQLESPSPPSPPSSTRAHVLFVTQIRSVIFGCARKILYYLIAVVGIIFNYLAAHARRVTVRR